MSEIKEKADLHRKYANALDLCDKHGIDTESACRVDDCTYYGTPTFTMESSSYTFPVAVVEGKCVFVGDKLWHKDGTEYTVQAVENHSGRMAFRTIHSPYIDGDFADNYSWNPPKPKTFVLNGVELVMPLITPDNYSLVLGSRTYFFKAKEDGDNVYEALCNLLDGKQAGL